jgi:hypothetical protein
MKRIRLLIAPLLLSRSSRLGDYLEDRRVAMEKWADFLRWCIDPKSEVIPLQAA